VLATGCDRSRQFASRSQATLRSVADGDYVGWRIAHAGMFWQCPPVLCLREARLSWLSLNALALGAGLTFALAGPAGAQRLESRAATPWRPALRPSVRAEPPPAYEVGRSALGWAGSGAALSGAAGYLVDQVVCAARYGDAENGLFGRCSLFGAGSGAAAGWFGGGVAGATLGAARVARQRGCRARAATWRALAGAALGAAPGLLVVARSPEEYPPGRTALVAGAPLLAGAGAAVAVIGCRAA